MNSKDGNSFFDIRKQEYKEIIPNIFRVLKPLRKFKFLIKEFKIKEVVPSVGDLTPTYMNKITLILKKGERTFDISFLIPKLIDDNFFIIGGNKKIPLFQLNDVPIIRRGNLIKIKTNPNTIFISASPKKDMIEMNFLYKKVPLCLMYFCKYTISEINKKYNLKNIKLEDLNKENFSERFLYELKSMATEYSNWSRKKFINYLGEFINPSNSKEEGRRFFNAFDMLFEIDIFAKSFLKTGNIYDELADIFINDIEISDRDFKNKRIRCMEYIVFSRFCKWIFDLLLFSFKNSKQRFKINSKQIISDCNVSDIVQFDFSINPIGQLTMMGRTTLTGPDGFKKDRVPPHLRDMMESMYNRICPVDTPDRTNCGILQNLVPNVKLDKNLKFSDTIDENILPISVPITMVPFMEHDDQTRLQMASSQMRQAVLLYKNELPIIKSGMEDAFTKYTDYICIAKFDGKVLYADNDLIVVEYANKKIDIFDISPKERFVNCIDLMVKKVDTNDNFKKGDILAESLFLKDGHLSMGRNLLTAIVPYHGENYKDAFVISESCRDKFKSIHIVDLSFFIPTNSILLNLNNDNESYKPLPNVGDEILKTSPYAIIQKLPDSNLENIDMIFSKPKELKSDYDVVIFSRKIYANNFNADIPQFNKWLTKEIEKEKKYKSNIVNIIKDKVPKSELKFIKKRFELETCKLNQTLKNKDEKLNGIYVKMYGAFSKNLTNGDKLANRHGNKGVVSTIRPENKMPRINGKPVDICINPNGIISRMNIGQLYEATLSMFLVNFKTYLYQMVKDKKDQETIKKFIIKFYEIIDNTSDKRILNKIKNEFPKTIDKNYIKKLDVIQPPFESININDLKKLMSFLNVSDKYTLYDPVLGENIENPVTVGYIYFYKLNHIAEFKMNSRSIGSYNKKTLQPLGGKRNKGGQRAGEMEIACLIAHEAYENLDEFLTVKSDCIELKNNYIQNNYKIGNESKEKEFTEEDLKPESIKLLNSYFKLIGVDIK